VVTGVSAWKRSRKYGSLRGVAMKRVVRHWFRPLPDLLARVADTFVQR
jgi:hypothetical protein